MIKKCKVCNELRDVMDFYKDSGSGDGFHYSCKKCESARQKAWRDNNKEYNTTRISLWRKENPDKVRAHDKKRNKTSARKSWARARHKRLGLGKKRWAQHRQTETEKYRTYRLANLDKDAARSAHRRATKLCATPYWLSDLHLLEIKDIYKDCQEISHMGYGQFHVDHIQPLKGLDRCGLHVAWNLQILTAKENLMKHNRVNHK